MLSNCAGRPHATSAVAKNAAAPQTAAAQDIEQVKDIVPANPTVSALHALTLDDLPTLKNLTGSDLLAKFGQPDFTRREAEAEIWQYRGTSCVLDLFLYPNGDHLTVADAITRSRIDIDGPQNSCMPSGDRASPS